MVHDVQIFNGLESFMAHADMENAELAPKLMNWLPKYDKSIPFKGTQLTQLCFLVLIIPLNLLYVVTVNTVKCNLTLE